VFQELLGELDLDGVLIQAYALQPQRPLFGKSRSRVPTFCGWSRGRLLRSPFQGKGRSTLKL